MNQTPIETEPDDGRPKPVDKLVPMDAFANDYSVSIDLIYARADHPDSLFGEQLYHDAAKLWLHADLARIVLCAARLAKAEANWDFRLMDGLRPVEAQAAMYSTACVRANSHWADGLLSMPGRGGHPRGMAIDIKPVDSDGSSVDMGTAIDELPDTPDYNPSARACRDFNAQVLANRQALEEFMIRAADMCGQDILPLPAEWWDFRFPKDRVNAYAPIREADLYDYMHVTTAPRGALPDDCIRRCETIAREVNQLCPG